MAGRPRKPTRILKLAGTFRKDRHGDRFDSQIDPEVPNAPEWLTGEGLAEWDRLTGHIQYRRALAPIDRGALATYCTMWANHVECVKAGGLPSSGLIATMLSVGGKLGLNPVDRAKLQVPSAEKTKSPWAALRTPEVAR